MNLLTISGFQRGINETKRTRRKKKYEINKKTNVTNTKKTNNKKEKNANQ